jgi:hypothetical protein
VLLAAAKDDAALVRAEAVKAAVEFDGYDAIEAIFEASVRPTDPELDTVIRYAKQRAKIDQGLQDAIASNKKLSDAAMEYALKNASPESLLKLPKAERVYQAVLDRANASTDALREALKGLSDLRKESSIPVILKLVSDRDQAGQTEALKGLRELLLEQPLGRFARTEVLCRTWQPRLSKHRPVNSAMPLGRPQKATAMLPLQPLLPARKDSEIY